MTPNPQDSAVALEVERVYLVATGETYEGQETYTRHEVRPPLCDAEVLYTRASQSDGTSGGWRPIETAPKDGTGFLLTNGKDVSQGWWVHEEPYIREQRDVAGVYIDQQEHEGFDGWMDCDGGMQPDPTFWMPLPVAPNQGENHVG